MGKKILYKWGQYHTCWFYGSFHHQAMYSQDIGFSWWDYMFSYIIQIHIFEMYWIQCKGGKQLTPMQVDPNYLYLI